MIEKSKEKEAEEEEYVKETLAKAEISLLLDSYDDIFSDFDPRPYSKRALSDDFLIEAKKAALDKQESLELRFLIPKHGRKFEHEILIKKRLREHFKRHAVLLEKEITLVKKKGFFMAFLGVLIIMFATYFASLESKSLFIHFLVVLLEPAGWFTAWTGLDEIYYTTKQKKPDFNFYSKMTTAEINFISY